MVTNFKLSIFDLDGASFGKFRVLNLLDMKSPSSPTHGSKKRIHDNNEFLYVP